MLKDSKGLKITLLVIVLIILFVNFLPGNSNTFSGKQMVRASNSDSYNLTVKGIVGDVSIILDPTATQISASYSSNRKTRSQLVLEQNGSNLTIREDYKEQGAFRFFNFTSTSTPTMMVMIPQNAVLRGLTVETVSGDISMDSNISAEVIKLASTSGDIDFLDLVATAGNVQIETISGYVEGYAVSAENAQVKVSTTSGSIDIYSITAKNINLNSINGDIYGLFAPGNGSLKMTTISGEIDVQLDPQTNATINAKSLSGDIQVGPSNAPVVQKSTTATIGDGTGSISANSTSGEVTISW